MKKNLKRTFVLTLGIIFVILGFFGLVLPFLQGIIFLAIGIILISIYSPKTRFWISKRTIHHPRLFAIIGKIESWLVKFIGKM